MHTHTQNHGVDQFVSPVRDTEKPLRMCVSDAYRGGGGKTIVTGKIETGTLNQGTEVIVMPIAERTSVRCKSSILYFKSNKVEWFIYYFFNIKALELSDERTIVCAGENVVVTLNGLDSNQIV